MNKIPRVNIVIATLLLIGVLVLLMVGIFYGGEKKKGTKEQVQKVYSQFLEVIDSPKGILPETIIATTTSTTTAQVVTTPKEVVEWSGKYIEVIDGCGPYYGGACLSVRSGPGLEYPKVYKLRTGMVLKVSGTVTSTSDVISTVASTTASTTDSTTEKVKQTWYKVTFSEHLRYPERHNGDWYVAADFVREVRATSAGYKGVGTNAVSNKKIIVDRSEQMAYAYDDGELFMKQSVSTGKGETLTPRGTFSIFSKTPSRYMQGPLPGISDQVYDLPGVPWTMYFTEQGGAFHGAYWHDKFGQQWSHGCVNLPIASAEKLYNWADIGTVVVVRD